jgi:RNA polymerase sigma factor (sigma-70 family)
MRTPDLAKVIESLPRGNASDGDLLDRYVRERNDLAFTGIVHRHGPMVWAVCRRLLRDEQDCEDAFQAVFLLLVRKAGSVRRAERLASWLHRVAYRTAIEARKVRRNRLEKEARAAARTESDREYAAELREVLDSELARLPEKHRAVLVLCHLEGRTRSEVALQLGVAEGTVASRLSRGKAILARRLARYGLPSGAVAAVLANNSFSLLFHGIRPRA